MAQHNTDYGLVYNDDGSLCVTKRTDIIPFSGVTSYAVETGTTNLITNMDLTTWSQGGTWDSSYERLTGEYFMGQPIAEFGKPGEDRSSTGYVDRYISQTFSNLTEGDVYTFSIYVYVIEAGANKNVSSHNSIWIHFPPAGEINEGYIKLEDLPTNKWIRVETTRTIDSNLTARPRIDFDNSYIRLACPQFEKKPFASSFVNGSRPNGRLVVPLEKLGFNPATDDWVVHYWKYPVATHDNSLNMSNGFDLGHISSGNVYGRIWWGKEGNYNRFLLHIIYNDNTVGESRSLTFDPAWYFRHWHHEVLLKHGNEMQYWVDGTLQIQMALAKPLLNNFINGLTVGSSWEHHGHNSYIANLCYGLYTDQWTPEYIQEIYQQRNGFFVPPKAVIV